MREKIDLPGVSRERAGDTRESPGRLPGGTRYRGSWSSPGSVQRRTPGGLSIPPPGDRRETIGTGEARWPAVGRKMRGLITVVLHDIYSKAITGLLYY